MEWPEEAECERGLSPDHILSRIQRTHYLAARLPEQTALTRFSESLSLQPILFQVISTQLGRPEWGS